MHRSKSVASVLFLSTLAAGPSACTLDELEPDAAFRGEITTSWKLERRQFADFKTCAKYYEDRCAGLTTEQCAMVESRFACEPREGRLEITDRLGARIENLRWTGVAFGGAEPSVSDKSPLDLCSTLACDPQACLGLAQATELLDAHHDDLVGTFADGGRASLSVEGGTLVVGPYQPSELDLFSEVADSLGWPVPDISAGTVAIKGADAINLDPGTVAVIGPNGSVRVSTRTCALSSDPIPLPQPATTNLFYYSMDYPGLNNNQFGIPDSGGWTRYAMHWKRYHDHNVGWANIQACYVDPNFRPLVGTEATLNTCEATHFVDSNGAWMDPAGDWMSVDINDDRTGFVFASLLMWYWSTPVFFTGYWALDPNLPQDSWYQDFALEQIAWTSDLYTNILQACQISPFTSPQDALNGFYANPVCDFAHLDLSHTYVTAWAGPGSSASAPAMLSGVYMGAPWAEGAYNYGWMIDENTRAYVNGELVFDPPAEASSEDIDAVLKMAELMATQLTK